MQVVSAWFFVVISAAGKTGVAACLAADATVAVAPRLICGGSSIYIALLAEQSLLTSLVVILTPVEGLPIGEDMIKGFLDAQLARNVLANGVQRSCLKVTRSLLVQHAAACFRLEFVVLPRLRNPDRCVVAKFASRVACNVVLESSEERRCGK